MVMTKIPVCYCFAESLAHWLYYSEFRSFPAVAAGFGFAFGQGQFEFEDFPDHRPAYIRLAVPDRLLDFYIVWLI
jgi:hypothetical protein